MASDCSCIKISFYCLDESSFDIYMNIAGYFNDVGLFIGSYDGETYSLQYNTVGDYWSFQNINTPLVSIFTNITPFSQTPCQINLNNWLVDDISNFNYCSGDFDGLTITNLTDLEIPNPNCGTLFTGGCSCQTLVNTSPCTVYYTTCNGILNQQYLPDIGSEITGCFSGSPIFYDGQTQSSLLGTITPFTETTCDYYCITGDSCCLSYTFYYYNPSCEVCPPIMISSTVTPIGMYGDYPFFVFSIFLNSVEKILTLFYDAGNSIWVLTNINGIVLFDLASDSYCPTGVWNYAGGNISAFSTELIDCPFPSPTPTQTPTPTPSQTPTPTPTPNPIEPPIPPCLQGTNECNVITLFQMGVECQVTHPTNIDAPDGSATLIITGGTPPYSVFWDNNNIGTSIYNLSPGSYNAIITDYYGDFTANTTCVLTGETPTPSPTPTPTPTTPFVECPLYVIIMLERNPVSVTFTPNGIVNGKPSWVNGPRTISWSITSNQWVLSPSPGGSAIINNNPSTPPLTGWQILGYPGNPTMQVSQGDCQNVPLGNPLLRQVGDIQPLSVQYSKNEPICGCEGTITLIGYGGISPYQYSINGGVTYRNIPMFTNLCSGIYNINIMDSIGTIVSDSVKLNTPSNPTTYVVSLNTSSTTTINNGTILSKTYTTKVNVTPSLSDGITLTFDISHTNTFKTSPNTESSTNSNGSILYKNLSPIDVSYSSTTTGSTFNTKSGCQSNTINITSTTDNWQTIQMSNTDEIIITTISTITQNEFDSCYVGSGDESYSVTNLKLSGCGCCNVISG